MKPANPDATTLTRPGTAKAEDLFNQTPLNTCRAMIRLQVAHSYADQITLTLMGTCWGTLVPTSDCWVKEFNSSFISSCRMRLPIP